MRIARSLGLLLSLSPGLAVAADAAMGRLKDKCEDDGRSPVEKARLVFASGAQRQGAVDALGARLGARVQRVDVSQLVSQYIGETEKNLAKMLRPDPAVSVVLFFDEADALFGVRSSTGGQADASAVAAVIERLGAAARPRVIVLGLRERPVVGRLSRFALSALSPAPAAPWPAVCGPKN